MESEMASFYRNHHEPFKTEKHGYGSWYQSCNCCPYGYHIDLDFVQFCDSIVQPVDRTGSIKKRRDRRRQRQSMEVLLGLEPYPVVLEQVRQKAIQEEVIQNQLLQNDLDEAVSDFERTLKRSKKYSSNLPDVTAVHELIRRAPSVSSISSVSGSSMTVLPPSVTDGNIAKDFDTMSVESFGLSPVALQNIREQMALSLERTRELEERVKLIPTLQTQLAALKKDKQQLMLQVKEFESSNFNKINGNYLKSSPPTREIGVSCAVLTRHVGVGHQCPNTRSASTTTLPDHSDKWYKEKVKFLENLETSKSTQTPPPNKTIHSSSQTSHMHKIKVHSTTQTPPLAKPVRHIGVEVKVSTTESANQTSVLQTTIGVSDDTTNDPLCVKCSTLTQPGSLSLATLGSRSKSFTLEDRLNLRNRTVGCQYELNSINKACQSELKTQSKSSQKDLKIVHKAVQHEYVSFSKSTDTKGANFGHDQASNTLAVEKTEIGCNTTSAEHCVKCNKLELEEVKKEDSIALSRIPRLQVPVTPIEVRKFKRQDTYTKIPVSTNESLGLSGLDLSLKHDNELPSSTFEKVKQSYKLNVSQEETPNLPDACSTAQTHDRKKVKPSKEMQAAMKVVNDSLQKGQTKNLKTHLKSATNIIQQEWFKISSMTTADPLDVEDYLDNFEEISCDLLQFIVNVVDATGNTAMHYAVSHGNFDVVSILLDSKVCDINQMNKAGYTSVMLVSLAVCSITHANVVRRLFQLADVNIRAKHHGQTALMLAVSHGRLDMVQMLLEAGADINIQDDDGSTALMCASEHGHIDIVKYLLSLSDCDSTIVDVDGSTALKIAMEAGHRHIGVLLYAHERNLHGASGPKLKRTKSASGSPKTPSSPLPLRSSHRALCDSRSSR